MNAKPRTCRILVTDHVFPALDIERDVLAPLGAELLLADRVDEARLAELAAEAQGMLVCFAPVTAAVVDAAAQGGCRVIARYGIGVDNVDVAAATQHGIAVTNVPDYCLDEVADHTMALLLGLARGIVGSARVVTADGWSIDHAGIHRIRGRRLALIGYGGIGRRVAARALSFGLEVVAYDPFISAIGSDQVTFVNSLEGAISEADFVSLHVPATAENHHLIDADALALMRRAPVLINTARGALVDLDAALAALEDGRLAGLAIDVTEPEPLPEGHPLRDHPRAIVTPHMAFHSEEATEELQRRAATEVLRVLRGQAPDRLVNPEALSS